MRKILSAAEMRACDNRTIEYYKVPSLVLMERAALAVSHESMRYTDDSESVGIICGPGNNGGDGVAVARILQTKGMHVKVMVLGNPDKFSKQLKQEIETAKLYDVCFITEEQIKEFDDCSILVDAMFGIGLTRGLNGSFEQAAKYINSSGKFIVAVDIPSGYDTDSGKLLGETGVIANKTVTFAYEKKGLYLGECKAAAGQIIVADVGIYSNETSAELLDEECLKLVPERKSTANKGTCGKVLVIAGSEEIYGACYLAAKAAMVAGAGLVKVYTHKNNIASIQQNLPEAMYKGYDKFDEDELKAELKWADAVVLGPGLGTSELSCNIMKSVADEIRVPIIVDADGLNIIAKDLQLLDDMTSKTEVILTPHLKEMERLCGTLVSELNYNMELAVDFSCQHNCTVVLKNHTELITDGIRIFYCISGNEALATGGSGDVLAGIIGALLGQKMSGIDAAAVGAYVHGAAGTKASKEVGIKGLLAGDIIAKLHLLI